MRSLRDSNRSILTPRLSSYLSVFWIISQSQNSSGLLHSNEYNGSFNVGSVVHTGGLLYTEMNSDVLNPNTSAENSENPSPSHKNGYFPAINKSNSFNYLSEFLNYIISGAV